MHGITPLELIAARCRTFNTPLEMPRFWSGDLPLCLGHLSILRWRCIEKMAWIAVKPNVAFNTPLEMPGNTPLHEALGVKIFQYSVGDARAIAAYILFSNFIFLSILRWRCGFGGFCLPWSSRKHLSILRWRCWGFLSLVVAGF